MDVSEALKRLSEEAKSSEVKEYYLNKAKAFEGEEDSLTDIINAYLFLKKQQRDLEDSMNDIIDFLRASPLRGTVGAVIDKMEGN